jgi:hypothetical protein
LEKKTLQRSAMLANRTLWLINLNLLSHLTILNNIFWDRQDRFYLYMSVQGKIQLNYNKR